MGENFVNSDGNSSLFSLRFKLVVEMVGWDEEVFLFVSLVVEDMFERNCKYNKCFDLYFKIFFINLRRY